jgi:hypothetical protein
MKRIARWLAYLFAAIVLISLFACGYVLGIDPIKTLSWHCFHSNKQTVDGHTCSLPIWWRPIKPWGNETMALTKANIGMLESFPNFSIHKQATGVKDEETVVEDQQKIVTALNRPFHNGRLSVLNASLETIHTVSLNFYCWKTEPAGADFATITCEAPGTDWQVDAAGNRQTVRESEQILQSFR